ncbi:MAG: T9SS type A sorting domain-containing protein [Candidatus Neomarinimicrobiota bacterium]|jgi:hypothetical protein|nr:T9SS type A sorting domain-containing protein [Candidatus Neomarinimicrobiota bacterium]MDD3966553.1 T9SS type A sorting domain-containing protein [Candidatus Neomarinimicrobiota bacterium]
MKKILLMLMSVLLGAAAFATSIRDIQYTTAASGDSPLKGQTVTVSGIVSGEPYAFGGNIMFIHDAEGPWNGIMVDLGVPVEDLVAEGVIVAQGDSVTVSGTVVETNGMTQIASVTSLVHEKAGVGCFAPTALTTGTAGDEQYEACLIRVNNAAISSGNTGNGEWEVNDGSGVLKIANQDMAPYYFWPEEYQNCLSISGLLYYGNAAFKVLPRLAWDIVEGPKIGETTTYTRIQRIQQVRVSDLMKTPDDEMSDMSYFVGDTNNVIHVKGIVTMPTGISFAGDGVKFILSDVHSGPWSAILSYNADASIYPDLFAGDLIEMSGYIDEFTRAPANMTEFFLRGDIVVLDFDVDLPDTSLIKTGDLRHPVTAEQWGNCFVKIENAVIKDNDVQYYIFEVDDGSGSCLIGYDSDSLASRAGNAFMRAPVGTNIESINGWVYHHYGSYDDSTTYNINPLYKHDIVLGDGPVMLMDATRSPSGIPASDQSVTVSIHAFTARKIETAKLYYKVDGAAFTELDMVDTGNDIWSAVIPEQSNNAIVEYYYYFTDDSSDVSALPEKYNERLFAYKVLDNAPTIYDIQYTHAQSGLSPLHGCSVEIVAYVTMEGSQGVGFTDNNGRGIVSVAATSDPWNAVWVLTDTLTLKKLHIGDLVTVSGKVDDDHDSYDKWQKNTYIVGTVRIDLAGEFPPAPLPVTLDELENNFEAYEGVLVSLTAPAKISAVNEYDITVTDGLNSFLLDDDFVADSVLDINYMENAVFNARDTLLVGDSINTFTGLAFYSYGSAKLELRKSSDVTYTKLTTPETAIDPFPSAFKLSANYPNPFNPLTTLCFELPYATQVRLQVYDLNGRLVEELANANFSAGSYELKWNASRHSSGVYIYRMITPEYTASRKMLLLK